MRILFVEDNSPYAETIVSVASNKYPDISWDVIGDTGTAEELIRSTFYDLVILDLCMPNVPSGLDKNVENGQRLFYLVQELMPGTPIYILTGSDLDSFATGLSRHGERIRLWGAFKEYPTVLYFRKNKTTELIEELAGAYSEIASLNSIVINTRGKAIAFSVGQERALKTFVRSLGGFDGVYYPLNGLSGSLVGRVEVRDNRFIVLGAFVAKLGLSPKIQRENESYARYVRLMPINTFTPLLSGLDKGLKEYNAIFYTLAEGYRETLFDVIRRDAGSAVEVIRQVRASLERWTSVREVSRVKIREVRRARMSDEEFDNLVERYDIPYVKEIEDIYVSASISCIHGDLHGGNILVNAVGTPVLIDFGDVGVGFTSLDPITLEMSLIFHPDCVLSGVSQEMHPFLEHWPDIDGYCESNPFGDVVKFCRDWAYDVGGDDHSVLAAGYAFAVRQLKYDTVNPDVTLSLIARVIDALRGAK